MEEGRDLTKGGLQRKKSGGAYRQLGIPGGERLRQGEKKFKRVPESLNQDQVGWFVGAL